MNKRPNRNNQRAPTAKPATSIAPSATMGLDGDVPLSASHGVTAPEPLAAHDVLQAAMAPLDTGAAAEPATETPAPPAETPVAVETPKGNAKKPAKAANKDATAEVADVPAKAAKVAKDKFVKVSFSLPESEAGLLDAMKKTHQGNGVAIKKSQLLRAGLLALADLDSDHIAKLLAHLPAEAATSKKKK
jgi:hypothetical protein